MAEIDIDPCKLRLQGSRIIPKRVPPTLLIVTRPPSEAPLRGLFRLCQPNIYNLSADKPIAFESDRLGEPNSTVAKPLESAHRNHNRSMSSCGFSSPTDGLAASPTLTSYELCGCRCRVKPS